MDALPNVRDALAFEDAAANMARSAMRFGVNRFYNMQQLEDQNERNADTVAAITNAEAMWLCANSGASYLDPALYRHWPSVEQRLRAGVPYKVVLLDPFCQEKQLRDQLNVGEDVQDTKINIPNLVHLHNEYHSIEIRFVDRGMHGTVFATPSCAFYDPYHLAVVGQRIENRSFCMKIGQSAPPTGVGYYDLLRGHFDSLWGVSQDFEAWIDENAARIDQILPDLRRRRGDAG